MTHCTIKIPDHVPDTSMECRSIGEAKQHFMNMVAKYEHGGFVFIGTEKPQSVVWPEWMEPIVEWFQSAYPGENWLRFDSVGDEIDGLYLYDW